MELVIGGFDDAFTNHHDLAPTMAAVMIHAGLPVVLSHSPDPFADLPLEIPLMVAAHTHCGQLGLPLTGALSYMSKHGQRYSCGLIRERGRTLVVILGLGTSLVPLRIGAVPDMRLIRIRRKSLPQ